MKIRVTYGVGEGETKSIAFDHALFSAGIANYNLIRVSSIIPKNSNIEVKKLNWNQKEIGNKLYVALAEKLESKKGKKACAGIGWVQRKDGSGIFVEIEGSSKREVANLIKRKFSLMQEYRKERYDKINYKTVEAKCKGKPVCVLVVAVYKSEGWQ